MNTGGVLSFVHRASPRGIAAVLVLLVAAQGMAILLRTEEHSQHPLASVEHDPLSLREVPASSVFRVPSVRAPARARTDSVAGAATGAPNTLRVFGGLGTWVDEYDFEVLDPRSAVALMKRDGVRTLYIQTGRYNMPFPVAPQSGPWLAAAHAVGIAVVGWYLPDYKRFSHDVSRTVAIAHYRFASQRFDGIGIDIEEKSGVPKAKRWDALVGRHASVVRAAIGSQFPLAAITPPPLQMALAPRHWAGFPWRKLGAATDAIVLMNYWSYRHDCAVRADHCAYGFTLQNVRAVRALTGRPSIPVHVAGGVGDVITSNELAGFMRAVRDSGAYGASLYDFRTTPRAYWKLLAAARGL